VLLLPHGQVPDEFRSRQARCNTCHNAYMREYRKALRAKMDRQSIKEFLTEVRRAKSLCQVEGVVAGMTALFGGVEGFCRAWSEDMDAAEPGSRARLNSFVAIAQMARLLEPTRSSDDPSEDIFRTTEAELAAEIEAELHRVLTAMLESEGWTRPEAVLGANGRNW
jgi:hypothetical protein